MLVPFLVGAAFPSPSALSASEKINDVCMVTGKKPSVSPVLIPHLALELQRFQVQLQPGPGPPALRQMEQVVLVLVVAVSLVLAEDASLVGRVRVLVLVVAVSLVVLVLVLVVAASLVVLVADTGTERRMGAAEVRGAAGTDSVVAVFRVGRGEQSEPELKELKNRSS